MSMRLEHNVGEAASLPGCESKTGRADGMKTLLIRSGVLEAQGLHLGDHNFVRDSGRVANARTSNRLA